MDYQSAHDLAANQNPVRRSGWPADHHVRHHVEESRSMLKLHAPHLEGSSEWVPNSEDEAAQDWEQYIPRQQQNEQQEEKQEEA